MVLADTSAWIDYMRHNSLGLSQLLDAKQVLGHPMILGEIMMGSIRNRNGFTRDYRDLAQADVASNDEVLSFIESHNVFGTGIGFVDAHVLCSALLSDARILTLDKALMAVAQRLGVEFPRHH